MLPVSCPSNTQKPCLSSIRSLTPQMPFVHGLVQIGRIMYRLESAVLGAASGYAALSNSGINVGDRELGLPCPVRE